MLYTAGTISATSGSAEISGAGTNWVGSVFPGDNFYIGGAVYPIEEITDSETLTLAIPYIGAAQSGADYAIGKTGGRDCGLAQRVIALTNRYGAALDGNDQTIATMQSTVDGVVGEVEAKKAALQTAVDGFIEGAMANVATPRRLAYDPTIIHSKDSLAIPSDPDDETRTEWAEVSHIGSVSLSAIQENMIAGLVTSTAYSYRPGHYETPQYSHDTSRTYLQFVVANNSASSAQINERLIELGIIPVVVGAWSARSHSHQIPIVRISGLHPYARLFCRFANLPAPQAGAGAVAQPVASYGGNASFSLHALDIYTV